MKDLFNAAIQGNKCYLGDCIEDFKYIFKCLDNERVGMIFDVGHAILSESECSTDNFIREMQNKIMGVHLHWNDGKNDLHNALPKNWIRNNNKIWSEIKDNLIILENHSIEELECSILEINNSLIEKRHINDFDN